MKQLLIIIALFTSMASVGQQAAIARGNRYFKSNKLDAAETWYRKATQGKDAAVAQYNLGNTLYRKSKQTDAIEAFDQSATAASDDATKAKALYNKGVVHHKSNELDAAIDAYKQALLLTPADADIRKNLQLALRNRQQQQPDKAPQSKPKEQPKEEKKKDNPQPQKSKITRKQAEQYLKALEQKEQELQEKIRKKTATTAQPEKDW